MANLVLESDLTGTGVSQGDLVKVIQNIVAAIVELQTTTANFKAIYDAHTHECPGSSFAASRCSTPDTGAAENSLAASAASAFTNSGTTVPVLTRG